MILSEEEILAIQGTESLSVGQRVQLLFSELSVGINKFNAAHFNKSIHTVKVGNVYNKLKQRNNYFAVSFKHIQSPVYFNPNTSSFADYVTVVTGAIPLVKLVTTQAEDLYRGLKQTAAKGQVPRTMRNGDVIVTINKHKELFKATVEQTKEYTRPVSDFYPSWTMFDSILQNFNQAAGYLKSRDMEVLSDEANKIIKVTQILKQEVDASSVSLNDNDREYITDSLRMLNENMEFIGTAMAVLSELTAVLTNQVSQLEQLN